MKIRTASLTAIGIALLYLSSLHAQQLALEATGNGTIQDSDGKSYAASFEMWGDGESNSFIKIAAPDLSQRAVQIILSSPSPDGRSASGYLTPCDGGSCPCSLESDEAQTKLSGTCTNPENETLSFNFNVVNTP